MAMRPYFERLAVIFAVATLTVTGFVGITHGAPKPAMAPNAVGMTEQ